MSTIPRLEQTYEGASFTFEDWYLQGTADESWLMDNLTALTFTIKRHSDNATIGAANRDGFGVGSGANGVILEPPGTVRHTIVPADNALLVAGLPQKQYVQYKFTLTGGDIVYRVKEYMILPVVP